MDVLELFGRQDAPELLHARAADVQPGDEVVWVTRCREGLPHHHAEHAAYTVIDSEHRHMRLVGPADEHHLPCDHPVLVLRNSGRMLKSITPDT